MSHPGGTKSSSIHAALAGRAQAASSAKTISPEFVWSVLITTTSCVVPIFFTA